jgi:alkylation response protein AidB-like acyl-CoA dehydrogenase
MEFRDSETQKLLRDTVRSFLADKYPWERLYAVETGEAPLTGADLKEFADLGWLGLLVPESAGGSGGSLLEAAVVMDEFGYAAVTAPLTASNIAADLLTHLPGKADVQDHLESLATGERLYVVSEATRRRGRLAYWGEDGRSPLSASGGKISGTLPLVPFGDMADFVLAPLAVDGEPGFALVALEGAEREQVKSLDRPGYFNVSVDAGKGGNSQILATGKQAEELHERCDALVTALSLVELVGMMQRVLEMTSQYISNRVQFGQPVAKFQAARHRAAEMLMHAETSRWAAYHALWQFQQDPGDATEIWLAKHWAIRAAEVVYRNGHMLHGGVGVGVEYPLHLLTQGIVAFIVRGGGINEMVTRTVDSLNIRAVAPGT